MNSQKKRLAELERPLRVYVGGSITDATIEFSEKLVNLKTLLGQAGFEVLEFIMDPTVSPEDVFRHDIEGCVRDCDFFLAVLDESSTGLGVEMAYALMWYEKPVLAVSTSKISRLITGLRVRYPETQYWVRQYSSIDQLVAELVPSFLSSIKVSIR